MFKKIKAALRKFFNPPAGSPRWAFILPYAGLGILIVAIFAGGAYGWSYTSSPQFCGTTCHTMPPENATYLQSPHSNVYCSECHIGRASFSQQLARKTQDIYEVYSMVFHTYTFPIFAERSRPALITCERCHNPATFTNDSLTVKTHFASDVSNSESFTYLIMHIGGGTQRQGLGFGIHWHIENKILYYATDSLDQNIPYIRVYNSDGTITEYTDVSANFDPNVLAGKYLKQMDCITCHNRVTHNIPTPSESMDSALTRGLVDAKIPDIKKQGVDVLSATYATQADGLAGIAALDGFYQATYPDYYAANHSTIQTAVSAIQTIFTNSVFFDQKVDWTTHPNNLGHIDSAGCFRCHDGKHLTPTGEAIPLECNLCHSIPVTSSQQDFVTNLEISRGTEPDTHLNSNWISLHNQAFDATCSNCHTVTDPGGISNTSFCSNRACHGTVLPYAGFNAPALRAIPMVQLPPRW